jgi:hypothetical protein
MTGEDATKAKDAGEVFVGSHELTLATVNITGTEKSVEKMVEAMKSAGIHFMVNGRKYNGHDSYTLNTTAHIIQPAK